MIGDEDLLLNSDEKQTQILSDLSHVSFEKLQKLKENLGTKVYNEAIFGPRKATKVDFKRENKNRPREMSAKKPVPRFKEIFQAKKLIPRDPRFDNLCGTFNKKAFKNAYRFVNDLRKNDLEKLQKLLGKTEDVKKRKKISYLIQRLKNQLREEEKEKAKEEKKVKEKKEIIESIKSGKKPRFKKKSETKLLDLVSRYEELKESGKLNKHIQTVRKKNKKKDKAKLLSGNSSAFKE